LFGRCAATFGEPATNEFVVAKSTAVKPAVVKPAVVHSTGMVHEQLKFFAPTAERLAATKPSALIALGLTQKRAETVRALAKAVAGGGLRLEPAADVDATMQALQALPGIGEWTAHYIAMRALGYPDAFPHADLGLKRALGLSKSADILAAAEPWRPWRAYAAHHLWASLH
jgi:AraC family transcriptional regulator of adaptative response / DNA-3-methyladenine glycosylase II